MPFDSEGIFDRKYNFEEDRVNDIDIVTDHMDGEFDNYAEGLSSTFLRDGRVAMSGDLDVGNFKVKNVAKGTLDTDAVNRKQLDDLKKQIEEGNNTFAGDNTFSGKVTITGETALNGETSAVTQEVEDSSNKVATTGFIKNVLSSNGAGLATVVKEQNGYIQFANGIIMQWGKYSGTNGTVTFPIPFTSTDYAITGASLVTGNQSIGWLQVGTKKAESCYCELHNYENSHHQTSTATPFNWIAIGY